MESRKRRLLLCFVFFNRGCITWLIVYVKDSDKKEILIMQENKEITEESKSPVEARLDGI